MPMQHELLEPLSPRRLAECVDKIPNGYPDASKKLQLSPAGWRFIAAHGFVMPEGPWTLDHHRRTEDVGKRGIRPIYTAQNPAPAADVKRWQDAGLRTDQESGLPIHPRAEQLLTTPGLGMFTQVGSFYVPGPNPIVNTGLRRVREGVAEYACVGVRRNKPKTPGPSAGSSQIRWSLPGGFMDHGKDETPLAAGRRETQEELGIDIERIGDLALRYYEDEPQYTWAATVHAWMQEGYYFGRSSSNPGLEGLEELVPDDREEVVAADWLSWEDMNDPSRYFMGTHMAMIDRYENQLRQEGLSGTS